MEVNKWMESLPQEDLDKVAMSFGGYYLTPKKFLEEVQNETERGKKIIATFEKMRLEIEKRKESK